MFVITYFIFAIIQKKFEIAKFLSNFFTSIQQHYFFVKNYKIIWLFQIISVLLHRRKT